MEKSASKKQFF
uniref:Uncharacterized protein n=1 Tax=Anguilla anguilla TaxID=7936 RepID=A0A0E9U7H3_ANGAN